MVNHFTPNEGISLLISFEFPLLYLILSGKRVWKEQDIQLSLCFFLMSWLEYAFLYETVETFYGNFSWARLIATYILWMTTFIHFAKDLRELRMDNKKQIVKYTVLLVIFALHLVCGGWYAHQMMIQPNKYY